MHVTPTGTKDSDITEAGMLVPLLDAVFWCRFFHYLNFTEQQLCAGAPPWILGIERREGGGMVFLPKAIE